jgi:DNA-binding beta-propeller fold protein YncE
VTVTAGSAANKLNSPHHIAADTNGQVYVTDPGNSRVQIFADPNNPLDAASLRRRHPHPAQPDQPAGHFRQPVHR